MQYVVIASGYLLLLVMLWLLAKLSYHYLTSPSLAQQLRVPVVTPLIPYIDKLFAVDFLPPFYFTYWIIIIAIIAVPHEFAHGIFARLNKIKIHSTGFGFLGPFLAAFVEQDEKQMSRAPRFQQLAILAAGTFANVLATLFFVIVLWLFIIAIFVPAGVYFNTYATVTIPTAAITTVNGMSLRDASSFLDTTNESLVSLTTETTTYATSPQQLAQTLREQRPAIAVYESSPALNARLRGAIVALNAEKITSHDALRAAILSHAPGDNITITTKDNKGKEQHFHIVLAEREGKPYLGIGFIPLQTRGIRGFVYTFITSVRDPLVYYESRIGEMGTFIYDLLWWIIVINISVALCNMLPVGIFDGGRFFYLTVWSITGSKKAGERAFKASTWIILALIILLTVKWIVVMF
jgi:membrane-associated protease RseP (regulator of RpoE activity)